MDLSQFDDFCNHNLDERRLEISVLKQIINNPLNSTKETNILIKSFIIFIYSNRQWFIDEISKNYLEYINYCCSKWICKLETNFWTWNLSTKILKENYLTDYLLIINPF